MTPLVLIAAASLGLCAPASAREKQPKLYPRSEVRTMLTELGGVKVRHVECVTGAVTDFEGVDHEGASCSARWALRPEGHKRVSVPTLTVGACKAKFSVFYQWDTPGDVEVVADSNVVFEEPWLVVQQYDTTCRTSRSYTRGVTKG